MVGCHKDEDSLLFLDCSRAWHCSSTTTRQSASDLVDSSPRFHLVKYITGGNRKHLSIQETLLRTHSTDNFNKNYCGCGLSRHSSGGMTQGFGAKAHNEAGRPGFLPSGSALEGSTVAPRLVQEAC